MGGVGGSGSLAQHHLHTIDLSHKRELSPLSITELSPVTKARGVQVDSVLLNGREVGGQGGVEGGREEFQFRYVSPLFIFGRSLRPRGCQPGIGSCLQRS